MNADIVISELEKRGGVADNEWHGDKIEMKTYEQRAEEGHGEGEDGEEQGQNSEAAAGRFEIEIEGSKSKRQNSPNGKDSNAFDALQRQRPTAGAVF